MSTNKMADKTLCLASASPQRLALLTQLGLDCRVMPMDVDETRQKGESAQAFVLRLALTKARKASKHVDENTIVLGADTTVLLDGEIFEKPVNAEEAAWMLNKLSGRAHHVFTGAGIVAKHKEISCVAETLVTFRMLTKDDVKGYIATTEPFGKAGAYAIQGRAAAFIERIQGSYSNVVGLPLYETASMLSDIGFDVMNSNQSSSGH